MRWRHLLQTLQTFPWRNTLATLQRRFHQDHLGLTASSLTFTTLLALVPFFTVLLSVFTAFPSFAKLQGMLQRWLIENLIPEEIATQVMNYLMQFASKASQLGIVGLAFLAVTVISLILTMDRTLNDIWRVQRLRPLGQRLLVYWAVLTLGPLLMGVSIATTSYVLSASKGLVAELPAAVQWAFNSVEFMLLSAAMAALYLLSPTLGTKPDKWTPRFLLQALETYIRSALQSSITVLSRALGQLPTLDKALGEVAARCQNIVSLEIILEATKSPSHPLISTSAQQQKQPPLLQFLLAHLETGSLPSYFWRTMASSLTSRVQDIVNRGGVVARTLRTNKNSVGDAVKQAVVKGCQPPNALSGARTKEKPENWDRESAVMVGSVVNSLR